MIFVNQGITHPIKTYAFVGSRRKALDLTRTGSIERVTPVIQSGPRVK